MDSGNPNRIFFSTDKLRERDRFPAVREEFARQLLAIDAAKCDDQPFSATFDIRRVGRHIVAFIDTSAADYVRTPELIRDGQEFVFATWNLNGSMYCSQPGMPRSIGPGEAALLDSTHVGGICLSQTSNYLTLRVPRSDVARVLPSRTKLAGTMLDPAAHRLLLGYLSGARNVELADGSRVTEVYDQHIFDLIVLALRAQGEVRRVAEERGGRAARREAVLREIEWRAGNPSLNAARIALLLGVTPRYVHQLLEETGRSFSHHLLERRLERAANLLRDPSLRHRNIATLAAEAGFSDISAFNRAFRRHFAATPSDIRNQAVGESK